MTMQLARAASNSHRAIIGIESAIVMIAFVLVAVALAFVVLNMGFSVSQEAKTTIGTGLSEASSSLEISGGVIGIGCNTSGTCAATPALNATGISLKIASGGASVNMDPDSVVVKIVNTDVEYDNIYNGTLTSDVYSSISDAMDAAVTAGFITSNPVTSSASNYTAAFLYWSASNTPQNNVLDMGEHANLAIAFKEGDRPVTYDDMRIEIIVAEGATLTIERDIPNISTIVVDLN